MHTSKSSKNYLLNAAYNEENTQNLFRVSSNFETFTEKLNKVRDIFQVAFRLARTGRKVLYIAAKAPESLPIEDEYDSNVYRDILKNIIFSYSENATDLIKYFMGMKQLQPKPDVMIVDYLHTFFGELTSLDSDNRFQAHFIDSHMLMTAAVFGVVDMFTKASRNSFISIVCIDPECYEIYKKFVQTYVDLYYYRKNCILSISDLMKSFP